MSVQWEWYYCEHAHIYENQRGAFVIKKIGCTDYSTNLYRSSECGAQAATDALNGGTHK